MLEKDQKDKAKCYSQRITSGKFLKKPKAATLVETKKRKSMKMGDIASAEEEATRTTSLRVFICRRKAPTASI